MKIIIKVDGEKSESENMYFSNDEINNENFIEFWIEGAKFGYMVSINDLDRVVKAFKKLIK